MQRVDSLEKILMLGGIGGRRRRGRQRMRWLDGITDLMDVGLSEPQELVMDMKACCAVIHGVAKSRTCWATELKWRLKTTFNRQHSSKREVKFNKRNSFCLTFFSVYRRKGGRKREGQETPPPVSSFQRSPRRGTIESQVEGEGWGMAFSRKKCTQPPGSTTPCWELKIHFLWQMMQPIKCEHPSHLFLFLRQEIWHKWARWQYKS